MSQKWLSNGLEFNKKKISNVNNSFNYVIMLTKKYLD